MAYLQELEYVMMLFDRQHLAMNLIVEIFEVTFVVWEGSTSSSSVFLHYAVIFWESF
jgi:hypothetical protein